MCAAVPKDYVSLLRSNWLPKSPITLHMSATNFTQTESFRFNKRTEINTTVYIDNM